MIARLPRIVRTTGLIWVAAIVAAVTIATIGCGGNSPLSAMDFATRLGGRAGGGGNPPSTQPSAGNRRNVCDLEAERRRIFVQLGNESKQWLHYSMTFVASAGAGGFVCDSERTNYERAGYRKASLVNGATTIGCDVVTLLGGTDLLVYRVSGILAQNPTADTSNPIIAQPPLNGGTIIPLPQLIVLGDEDPQFICTGTNLCTQRGFAYTDVAGNLISAIDVSRTQDTVCNAFAGAAPEWRLLNINTRDLDAKAWNYTSGGVIILRVLDRSNNANPNANQAVWTVFDVAGDEIHKEAR